MLVDQRDHPLHIGPIHRSVAALTIADLDDVSEDRGDHFETQPDRASAFAALESHAGDPERAWFVVCDGQAWGLVATARTHPSTRRCCTRCCSPPGGWPRTRSATTTASTRRCRPPRASPVVVVAVTPPSLAEVMASAAARALRMPRKSTSFAPKPRMGLVMRDLADE